MANLISARFGAKCAEHFVLFSYRSILLRVSECAPWEVLFRQFPYLPLMQQILKRSSTKTGLSWEDMGKSNNIYWKNSSFCNSRDCYQRRRLSDTLTDHDGDNRPDLGFISQWWSYVYHQLFFFFKLLPAKLAFIRDSRQWTVAIRYLSTDKSSWKLSLGYTKTTRSS